MSWFGEELDRALVDLLAGDQLASREAGGDVRLAFLTFSDQVVFSQITTRIGRNCVIQLGRTSLSCSDLQMTA